MSFRVEFNPVFLATRRGREPARLVIAGDRIAAILVPISPEDDESASEGWYLEVGFGRCEADGVLFASLGAAEAWVRAQLGSRLELKQPSANQPDSSAEQATIPELSPSPPPALRILIVEDDAIQALGLESHFQRLGHDVVDMVATGPAAIAAAEKHRPDLVFMDVRLAEGTNGIDAAAEIRERMGVPSIFMTAHADVQTRARIEQVRAIELLAKPVAPAAIAVALHKFCERPR